jgi:hypothetical protein
MKTMNILKKLITVYYYVVGIVLLVSILLPLFWVFNFMVLGNNTNITLPSVYKLTILILLLVSLLFFHFKSIRIIKMSLNDLSNGNYFSKSVIENFRKAGIYFLVCAVLQTISKIFSSVYSFTIELGIDVSVLPFLITGLFLMFLSESFLKGQKLQQENDLTI